MAINRKGTITASTQRACVGSLAAHLDKFAEFLVGEGYVSETIKAKYALVADLSHWLKQRGVPLAKLDETRLKQFHAHRRGSRTRRCIYRPSAVRAFAPPRSRSCVTTKSRPDRSGAAHTRLREILKFGARLGARDIDQLSAHRAKILNRAFREQGASPSGSAAAGPTSVHSSSSSAGQSHLFQAHGHGTALVPPLLVPARKHQD